MYAADILTGKTAVHLRDFLLCVSLAIPCCSCFEVSAHSYLLPLEEIGIDEGLLCLSQSGEVQMGPPSCWCLRRGGVV